MINVTKSYLPDKDKYFKYLEQIWNNNHLTNHGPLVNELEKKLKERFGVKHFFFVNNGTIALQIALKAIGASEKVITTPFSYVATTSSIVWENLTPVFADIDPSNLCINPYQVELLAEQGAKYLIATHVYGNPCDVKKLDEIATKHNLKIIYDAAHAFDVDYNGTSILNYGDISTLSFHATKLFHTIEGGAIITNNDELAHKISYMRNFGHNGPEEFWGLGINGKTSEFNAAMGLCILPEIEKIISSRKDIDNIYREHLNNEKLSFLKIRPNTKYNFAYFPVVLESENVLKKVVEALKLNNIVPRRYFYPSLNILPYVEYQNCPIAEDISKRVLCLPQYAGLETQTVKNIASIINKALSNG